MGFGCESDSVETRGRRCDAMRYGGRCSSPAAGHTTRSRRVFSKAKGANSVANGSGLVAASQAAAELRRGKSEHDKVGVGRRGAAAGVTRPRQRQRLIVRREERAAIEIGKRTGASRFRLPGWPSPTDSELNRNRSPSWNSLATPSPAAGE